MQGWYYCLYNDKGACYGMNIGFIGLGNMASAMIRGIRKTQGDNVVLLGHNPHREKSEKLTRECNLVFYESNKEVADQSDVLVLAVKPQIIGSVLGEIGRANGKMIVSVVAGRTLASLALTFPDSPVARVMPNINAKIGASITGFCVNDQFSPEQKEILATVLSGMGPVVEIEEKFAGIFSCIGGATPAFTYTYIDAIAEAALREGMPKQMALRIAAQSVLGCAQMLLETTNHPLALADQVCSPGGTTVEGIFALKKLGFEHTVHEAVCAVIEKDRRI